jgi:phytoene/squalene synthetase
MQHGAPITDTYRDLIRTLIDRAEAEYEFAWEGIIVLPSGFARGVAVAANVYRGIHHVIAKNRYDNLSRRAYTSSLQKFVFGFRARYRLSKARRRLLENGFNYDQTSDEVWSKLASSRY